MLAFIFDIDGTLVDSNELHVDSWDRAFRRFGKQFPREKLRAQIGKGSDQYLPEFLTPDEIDRFGKELDDYRSDLFKKEYLPKVRPFPKVRELFQRIRDDNKRIVLATSGKKADTKYYIDLLKIDNLIEGYTSGDDADNSKPAPDIFAASLKKLGNISSADAVTVGDTRFDIEAARKAGLRTIAFLCGGTSEATCAKQVQSPSTVIPLTFSLTTMSLCLMPRRRKSSFLYRHSLSLVAVGLLIVWIIGYRLFDPKTHLGAFFGNAIADWSGSVVIILGTKFLYEVGSAESRPVSGKGRSTWLTTLHQHSLLIFIVVTGVGWTILFLRMNVDSKWGQVVGNIVSEWVQMAGLVFLTKRLVEIGSKETK